MVNSKNIIAGLGVVAGLGVAMLPLTSYATTATEATGSEGLTQTVRAEVAEVFTIKVESNNDFGANAVDDGLALGTERTNTDLVHTITVTGNVYGGYDLKMGAVHSVLGTDLLFVKAAAQNFGTANRYDTNVKIATGTTIDGTVSNWGYKKTAANSDTYGNTWTAVPGSLTSIGENANSANAKFNDVYKVNFGIAASENQPAGVYEGQVTYSATSKI